MADDTDSSQKTEEPTPKKLEDVRRRGQVPSSREINHWFMLLAASIIVVALAPGMSGDIARSLLKFVERPDVLPADPAGLAHLLNGMIGELAVALLPAVAVLLIAALAAGFLQTGFLIAGDRIQPKLEKISLTKGVKRLFSLKAIAEFVKGLIKIAIVGAVATVVLLPEFDGLSQIATLEAAALMALLQSLSARLIIAILAVMTVVAGLDFLYQRFEHLKGMRMSRQEIKDELKQTEGDPQVKARLRQIRIERARKRMMAAVPEADVVITNPTHYAVALVYKPTAMAAPRLVAKGVDHMAQRIRDVAEEHDVPVVENPPLARALYAGVDIDAEIPPQHYRAVAEIIGYVFQLKGRQMTG